MSYVIAPMPTRIEADLLEKARRVETATIGHRRHMGFMDAAIQAILPGRRIAGTAVTLALPGQDSTLLHHIVQFLRPNDILVIDRLATTNTPASVAGSPVRSRRAIVSAW